jgi:hypothetical protein
VSIRIAVRRQEREGGKPAKKSPPIRSPKQIDETERAPLTPVLFEQPKHQKLLLEVARRGAVEVGRPNAYHTALVKAGILIERRDPPQSARAVVTMNANYPALPELLTFLSDLTGESFPLIPKSAPVHPEKPLGHKGPLPFRVFLTLAQAREPLTELTIRRRISGEWAQTVRSTIVSLVDSGALAEGEGRKFDFAPDVPDSFKALVLRLAEVIADPLFAKLEVSGPRPSAFGLAEDGAPLLFATDLRLRNFMALAVHGPLLHRELRRITGAQHTNEESWNDAPFGRGGVVRTWETAGGQAVALDEAHPLHPPLLRLLLRMAELYPLPGFKPRFASPIAPPPRPWVGDKLAFFGSDIRTAIMFSIGVYAWTFESLCCHFAGPHRENVKHAMRKLEAQGVIAGDRDRRPGANIRFLRIPDSFGAKTELMELLREGAAIWGYEKTVKSALLLNITPKTKAHIVRRGMWPDDLALPPTLEKRRFKPPRKRPVAPGGPRRRTSPEATANRIRGLEENRRLWAVQLAQARAETERWTE